MPISALSSTDSSAHEPPFDPLEGVDHIIVIDNGAHNIRIASIPYPFPTDLVSHASSSTSEPTIDPYVLASTIPIDVFPNAIARTRTPHTVPPSTSPTAPAPGTKTSIFVSSHIHTLLDDYAALHLRLPHQSGVVVDWAAQKQIWDHVFANHLAKLPGAGGKKGKLLQGKAVILTETYFNLEPVQYAMDLLLFEQYGAQAVWRTTAGGLVGLSGDVFRSEVSLGSTSSLDKKVTATDVEPGKDASTDAMEQDGTPEQNSSSNLATTSKRSARAPRASTPTTASMSIPRILSPSLPESLLVLDLGYSYCHAIPVIHSKPHLPSIRRLELGGKMLINLLKETLSFQQLDMMDESWLMSHIFARTSFVADSVGKRASGGEKSGKRAAEWTYEDLLALERRTKGKKSASRVSVTWSLPDYGGAGKGNAQERDRARYGFILDGPNPPPLPTGSANDITQQRKRPKLDPIDWESSFIASSCPTSTISRPRTSSDDDDEDTQTITLASERFSIMETLFNPTALSLDQQPLPLLVKDAISAVSTSNLAHARAAADMMWSNIVLTGGLAGAVGIKRRLENELRSLAPEDVGVKIWSRDGGTSLMPVKAGVVVACELSAREGWRREVVRGAKVVGGVGGKKKARKSRGATVEESEQAVDVNGGKCLTYAQWMNAGGGEMDIVRAANAVFYPPVEA